MVGKNDLRAIRDEQVAIDLHTARAQRSDFFQKGQGVEDHSVANHIDATGSENASGHQLQDEPLPLDDDGVTGVVSAGIAGDYRERLRKYVDDLAFTLVAPLGSDNDRSFASLQFLLRGICAARSAAPRVAHTGFPQLGNDWKTGMIGRSRCVRFSIPNRPVDGQTT